MANEITLWALLGMSITVAIIHTLTGPDHYVPFIALARSRHWSFAQTMFWTFLCGLGHIASALLIAGGFIYLDKLLTESRLEQFEAVRGNGAAFLLIVFGTIYALWGIRQAMSSRLAHGHSHSHFHGTHTHFFLPRHHHSEENGESEGAELKAQDAGEKTFLYWSLFVIFVFGPCESLLPIAVIANRIGGLGTVLLTSFLFCAATVATMMTAVGTAYWGLKQIQCDWFDRYSHTFAGLCILMCGCAILFLGL